jgi:transcription-repair coupling factor (superfamily II helicase)
MRQQKERQQPMAAELFPLTLHIATQADMGLVHQRIARDGVARVFGGPRAAAGVVAATLLAAAGPDGAQQQTIQMASRTQATQLLVLTADPEQANQWADEIGTWLPAGTQVLVFPPLEALPYERSTPEPGIIQQRQIVLDALSTDTAVVIIAPVRALLQPLLDPARYKELVRRLKVGARLAVNAEIAHWQTLGYVHAQVVQQPGQYCRRGGIIDVFPAGAAWPVRIELIGSEIESLRQFDPSTQRSVANINQQRIGPIHPFALPAQNPGLQELRALDCSRCLPHIQRQWTEELALLEQGVPFDGLDFYTPYLAESTASLLSYLQPRAALFVDDPDTLQRTARDLVDQAQAISEELVGRGEVPPGLRFPLLPISQVFQDTELLPRLEWCTRAMGRDGRPPAGRSAAIDEGQIDWSAGTVFRTAPSYAGSLKRFVQDCAELSRQQERVCIASLQSQRLAELLQDDGHAVEEHDILPALPDRGSIVTARVQLAAGWYAPNAHLMIFTDAEVAGWSRPRQAARFRRDPEDTFALDFVPGDYVVHIEHGIGRYEGVVRETSGRMEREFLKLQYAGTDVLKVPTDQLDRITKYRGLGEESPTLSRLGTQEWTRAKAKVKESIEAVARELLELYRFREQAPGHAFAPDGHWQRELEAAFPYEETPDQAQAINDVKADMEQPHPMDRLVCGDVGYGKTEVALRAAFKAVMDGRQVAVLVPTTILAQQHYNTFRERMAAFPVRVGVLSRFHSRAEQLKVVEGIRDGTIDIAVGTHRLLQKDVTFKNLGLLVIDEEQRFGVKHKEQLKRMRRDVDVLTLTATPIPRSLHMGLMQVRALSVIATPPEGRLPIKTYLEPFDEYHIREAILRELDRGGQVYFIHNRVQTIEAMAERLRFLAPKARLAVAHGQLPEAALERVMFDFADKKYDLLVCSTIVENGLDIPNVNTMLINEAPQFGLSQLYQLRGRIGRANKRAYAYLLYNPTVPISRTAERRLKAIFESTELGAGFQIALKDLEIRGAGNVLGNAQHGHMVAVGFQLYCSMLAETIEQQRGGRTRADETKPLPSINLQVDAYIPAEYVEDANQRLRLYQRLAAITSVGGVQELEVEIRDRFGPLPDPVRALLATVRIRQKAIMLDVSSVEVNPTTVTVRATPAVLFDRPALYDRYGMAARVDRGVLRVPRDRMGADPSPEIEEILDRALAVLGRKPPQADHPGGSARHATSLQDALRR